VFRREATNASTARPHLDHRQNLTGPPFDRVRWSDRPSPAPSRSEFLDSPSPNVGNRLRHDHDNRYRSPGGPWSSPGDRRGALRRLPLPARPDCPAAAPTVCRCWRLGWIFRNCICISLPQPTNRRRHPGADACRQPPLPAPVRSTVHSQVSRKGNVGGGVPGDSEGI